MKSRTRAILPTQQLFQAICWSSGFPTLLLAQVNPSSDGWLPRNAEPLPPRVEIAQPSYLAKPETSSQIPASPWEQTKWVAPSTAAPNTPLPSAPNLPSLAPSRTGKTISQPTPRTVSQFPAINRENPTVAQFIEQPKTSDRRWEQVPARGLTLDLNPAQPIVDLGLPIPTDSSIVQQPSINSTINSPTDRRAPPLEANRGESIEPNASPRRAVRNTESISNEVGQSEPGPLNTQTPSSIVGIVSLPSTVTTASTSIEEIDNATVPTNPSSIDELPGSVVSASMGEQVVLFDQPQQASQISRRWRAETVAPNGMAPLPVEPPTGWKSIEDELCNRMTRCDDLLKRNAVLSARDEVLTGLRVLFRAIDLRSGDWISEPALDQALSAFAEESDFQHSLRTPTHALSTTRIVAGHATQALKQIELQSVSPELAAQHYRSYARQQLVKAARYHPWAADLIYALGKTYERRGEASVDDSVMLKNQAVACYAAALDIVPNHTDSASQLGFTLLKLDRLDEAYSVLCQAIQTHPSIDAWRNLAEVYRRRGQVEDAQFAIDQGAMLVQSNASQPMPEVLQVDSRTFAGMSPNQYLNQPVVNDPTVTTASSSTKASVKSSSWFDRLLR